MPNKILIVDDDVNICELLRLYLEKDGFDTVIANDGRTAIEYAEKYSPNLIFPKLPKNKFGISGIL